MTTKVVATKKPVTKKKPRKSRQEKRLDALERGFANIRRDVFDDNSRTHSRLQGLDKRIDVSMDLAKRIDEHADGVLKHARAVDERLTQHEKHFDDLEEDLERRYTNDGCADLVARFHALEARLSMPGLVDVLTARLDLAEARVAALELSTKQSTLLERAGEWVSWLRSAPGVRDSLSR